MKVRLVVFGEVTQFTIRVGPGRHPSLILGEIVPSDSRRVNNLDDPRKDGFVGFVGYSHPVQV